MSQLRTGNREFFPSYPDHFCTAFIRSQFDAVMLADTVALLLKATNPLKQLVPLFFTARLLEPGGELGQSIFKFLDKPPGNSAFFFLPLFGITVQAYFRTIFVDHPLNVNSLVRCCSDGNSLIFIKLASSLTTDHQIFILMLDQPTNISLGCDPTIHDNQRTRRGFKPLQHLF